MTKMMTTMAVFAVVLAMALATSSTAPVFAQQLAPVYGPTSSYKMQVLPPSSAPAPSYPNLTPIVPSDGSMYTNISIGFKFMAYGVSYSTLVLNTCGFLNFGDTLALPHYGPQWTATGPTLFPFLSDWGFPIATVFTTTIGVAPFRTYVVRFIGVPFSIGASATFDVLLSESVNSIEVNYFYMELSRWGLSVMVGISDGPVSNATYPVDYVYLPMLNSTNIALLNLTTVVLTPTTTANHEVHELVVV